MKKKERDGLVFCCCISIDIRMKISDKNILFLFFFVVVRKQIQTEIIQRWNLFLIIKEIRKRNYQIQNYFYHKFSCFLYTWATKALRIYRKTRYLRPVTTYKGRSGIKCSPKISWDT